MYLNILYSYLSGLKEICSRSIYVGPEGNDEATCGKSLSPCKTIRFAVSNISQAGDTILVKHAKQQPYSECETCAPMKPSIIINKSLSIVGNNGTAFIRCRYRCILFEIRGNVRGHHRVELANLAVSMAQTAVNYVTTSTHVHVVLKNCWLTKNRIGISLRNSMQVSLLVANSVFQDSYDWGVYSKNCGNMSSVFMSSYFLSSLVLLETNQYTSLHEFQTFIFNCTFRSDRKYLGQKCSKLLNIKTVSMATNITVRQSTFSNNSGVCQAMSISEATNNYRTTTLITLDTLMVENNWSNKTIMYVNPFYKRRSKFKVKIINSVFQNNSARVVRLEIKHWRSNTFPQKVYILFSNNTFSKNGYFFRTSPGLYSPVLYLGKGRFRLYGCTFVDNYPNGTPNSAVLTPSDLAKIVIKDCRFMKRNTTKSTQIYAESNSNILFKGTTTFKITASLSDTIMVHEPFTSGSSGQVQVRGTLEMTCPSGYRLNFLNTNRHGMFLTYVYFHASCVQCPRKTYSIDKGTLKNNITNDIRCYSCPRGAVCESGQVYVKRGFWGHKNKIHEVQITSCPFGYCCEKETCHSYNHCYGNRIGTLCGRCPDGTSEPLFTTACRINEDCTAAEFWVFFSIFLILYILFFLFHEEITQFFVKSVTSREGSGDRNSTHDNSPSGYLKIFFFYYQMVYITLEGVPSGHNVGILSKIKSAFSQALNMVIVDSFFNDCPIKSLRPVSKSVFLHSPGLWMLVLIFLIYITYTLINWNKQRQRRNHELLSAPEDAYDLETERSNNSFRIRIGCAFTYVCLLMHSSLAKLCFSLLSCVQVEKDNVLFIDGTIKCYQTYQYFIMVYIVFSVLPFCFVPVLGCYLLFLKQISPRQLYLGCLFPLPSCCYWSYKLIKYCRKSVETDVSVQPTGDFVDKNREALLRILCGPFRTHKSIFNLPNSKIPWEGTLILCRLTAILSLTLSSDNRVRALMILTICLTMLVSHVYIRPFISVHENAAAMLSLCAIIIICALSLLKEAYHGEDFSTWPESQSLLRASDTVINTLLIIPVALLSFLVFVAFSMKLIRTFFVLLRRLNTAT